MIHQQTLLPHPYMQSSAQVVLPKAKGGIRKTSNQTIATLSTAYVAVTNYDSQLYPTSSGVTGNLVAGTITAAKAGDYLLVVNLDATCTNDNNAGRVVTMQAWDSVANTAIPNAEIKMFVGAYASGFQASVSIPFTVAADNKSIVMKINAVANISNVVILSAALALLGV